MSAHNHSASSGYVSADHAHGFNTAGAGTHGHNFGDGSPIWYNAGAGYGPAAASGMAIATFVHDGWHGHSGGTGGIDTNHTHGITVDTYTFNVRYYKDTHGGGLNDSYMVATHGGNIATTTNTAQTAVTNRNLQPYVTLLKIIRAA